MARITVEDCLTKETNRFALVLLAAKRTKQLLNGGNLLIDDKRDNKMVVTSLREIAAGKVRFKTDEDLELEREAALKEREAQMAKVAAQESPVDESLIFHNTSAPAGEASDASDDSADDEADEKSEEVEAPVATENGDGTTA